MRSRSFLSTFIQRCCRCGLAFCGIVLQTQLHMDALKLLAPKLERLCCPDRRFDFSSSSWNHLTWNRLALRDQVQTWLSQLLRRRSNFGWSVSFQPLDRWIRRYYLVYCVKLIWESALRRLEFVSLRSALSQLKLSSVFRLLRRSWSFSKYFFKFRTLQLLWPWWRVHKSRASHQF